MSFVKEFKEFAIKGNVIDLAVAVVIGGAFGKIVTSLVNDIIMPPIGLLLSGITFSDIKIPLTDPELDAAGAVVKEAVTINIGTFTEVAIQFVIVAFAIFLVVKMINRAKKKEEAKLEAPAPAAAPVVPEDVKLLAEIRDLLKKQ
jgi:large conductance mechanosensitive channel